jgi:hypothetical protein
MEWQTIDSAPKDGTPIIILVHEGDERMAIEARFDEKGWYPIWLDMHGCGCCGGERPVPTHWIPKPTMPGS